MFLFQMLTGMFIDKWNALLRLTSEVSLRFKLFGEDHSISIALGKVDVHLSIGGK